MSGELVFAGTRGEAKTLIDYRKADYAPIGFPTISREQAETRLETTLWLRSPEISMCLDNSER